MTIVKSNQKILVIDDEVEIGEMICEILIPYYSVVHYISDPEKVADHLDKVSYDLVLSDINMPKLEGTSLVSLIRSKGHLTSVIFVSGSVTVENALMALRLGVSDIIDKPFTDDVLLETIRHVIDLKKHLAQLHSVHRDPERAQAEAKIIGTFQAKRALRKA